MMINYKPKFSGKKQIYDSGATRDNSEGRGRFDLIPPIPLKQLAILYEEGAKNHGDNNWLKGFKFSRALDSALRHINQFKAGEDDENHLINAVWNLFAIVHFREMIERGLLPKELNDLPNYQPKPESEQKDEVVEEGWDIGTQFQPYNRKSR